VSAETILLVEDNPDDVLLIKRAFKKAGLAHSLQIASHGEAAVDYLAGAGPYADRDKHPFPVLMLLDLQLPRRSGHEVLAWLREQEGLRRLPVVVLTSSREPNDINRAYDLGANSYLVKPVSFDTLLDMVQVLERYWLALAERPEAARAHPSR
jgi:CheY-like chemotaxis protein